MVAAIFVVGGVRWVMEPARGVPGGRRGVLLDEGFWKFVRIETLWRYNQKEV